MSQPDLPIVVPLELFKPELDARSATFTDVRQQLGDRLSCSAYGRYASIEHCGLISDARLKTPHWSEIRRQLATREVEKSALVGNLRTGLRTYSSHSVTNRTPA
jgi:hypothetical protein